ncbi:MAG: signal peptidase I [Planctomycetota bacterium]|nr:MAG: signal peptidase I [Planctomycetota bacterium]
MIPDESTDGRAEKAENLSGAPGETGTTSTLDSPLASGREGALAQLFAVEPDDACIGFSRTGSGTGPGLARATRGSSREAWRPLVRLAVTFGKFAVVTVIAWGLLFNFSEVRGSSMEPGIQDHDRILVDHLSYLFGDVERGDIVVLRYPLDPSLDYIKRVIGLPGDDIRIAGGLVWVNGEPLEEPYVDERSIDPYTVVHTTVKPDHFYVLGDNRIRSSDSREFGQVAREYLRGCVNLRVWPLGRAGLID